MLNPGNVYYFTCRVLPYTYQSATQDTVIRAFVVAALCKHLSLDTYTCKSTKHTTNKNKQCVTRTQEYVT